MSSTITTSQNPANAIQLGGGKAWFRKANTDGTVASSDTWGLFPYLKSSTIKDETPIKEFEMEQGGYIYAPGSRKVSFEFTCLDRSVDIMTEAVSVMRGNYYSLLKQQSVDLIGGASGVYQYLYAPVLLVTPSVDITTQGNEVKVTFMCLQTTASITNTNWTGVTGAKSSTVTSASITCDPTTNTRTNCGGYYTWYEAVS